MNTWSNFIKDYQTLIAGVLAIIAAIIAFIAAIKAARTQAAAALEAAKAQITHFKEEEEATLRRTRIAFTLALQLAALRVENQARGLLSLVDDKEFSLNPSKDIINQNKISVPRVLRSRWEDMALLEERFQIMTEELVMKIESVNRSLDFWLEYHELSKIMQQGEMQGLEPTVNKDLDDIKKASENLINEMEEWIRQKNTIEQPNELKAAK